MSMSTRRSRPTPSPKGDVVVAINEIVSRLKNGGLSPERDKVDLMMLIHLVGDMHCPMHAGHKCDRGGNNIQVKYFHSNTKLHSVGFEVGRVGA